MTQKITIVAILAVSAGLLFAVPIAADAFHPFQWKDLESATAEWKGNSIKLSITAKNDIPKDASIFDTVGAKKNVAGYAWLDTTDDDEDGKIDGIVTAIHPDFRDSKQKPDLVHTHTVKLTKGIGAPNFCLAGTDLGTIQSGIAISGDTVKVNTNIKSAGIDPSTLDFATSFVIFNPEDAPNVCADGELVVRSNSIARHNSLVPITNP